MGCTLPLNESTLPLVFFYYINVTVLPHSCYFLIDLFLAYLWGNSWKNVLSPLHYMLSLSEAGLRLWKSDESIAALLQSWIRFLLQSPNAGAADTLGCETCLVRTRISPKATELTLFCEISLMGENSGTSSSLDTGLQGKALLFITETKLYSFCKYNSCCLFLPQN